jgi:hypothetical protein
LKFAGVIVLIIALIALFIYIAVSLKEAKNHCIPNSGFFNLLKIWVAHYIGIDGIECQG